MTQNAYPTLLKRIFLFPVLCLLCYTQTHAQGPDEDQLGAWYMYFFNTSFGESDWGLQGDFQYRDWRGLGDREQLLLRSGVTYTPKDLGVKFTLGYGNISSGAYGTDSDALVIEHRVYQEALLSNTILKRLLVTHRFRYEQRWVEDQDFRTRYRYNLFVNIPFNANELVKNTYYFAFYNELFINGERQIGDGRSVGYFDRNRTYLGLGYVLKPNLRFQLGWMQQTTTNWQKGQLQISAHHSF
ncbi:DUF2490 domain-containing protein [Altibacter sp.]|uniref:DUF2490 domain-containing protein n=1 Tax=Altibacter sp. TaxID=2024823 RepID=UPI000C927914|nr:DUF2490 domain-containing protein [Altibacter sp.]MAP55585.1 hypothetical protein [Altibacter sp.]